VRVAAESQESGSAVSGSPPVTAVVVTYHPKPDHLENLRKLRAQVDLLIVVDNGSADSALADISSEPIDPGLRIVRNGANLGIAAALNRGVREALSAGSRRIALFDQDSTVTDKFMASLIADFDELRKTENILQIVPHYRDPATGRERTISRYTDGGAFLTITSGSLFSAEAFEQCGLFREELFIYCVDDDYSLRIRKHGYYIGVSRNAVLLHQSGNPASKTFFGKTLSTKNYRPEVRYYYARNKVWILRQYGRTFPRIIVPTLREFVTTALKIALMEEAAWTKIKMHLHGIADGITGKMGPIRRAV
jgi:rhamnosyltransferase